jgi:hypothetical protein
LSDNLQRAIDALASKFKQRRIEYDIDRFRDHVLSALKAWQRSGHERNGNETGRDEREPTLGAAHPLHLQDRRRMTGRNTNLH